MNFKDYKTESLERIAKDPKYSKYHSDVEAILTTRQRSLDIKRGIEVLVGIAKTGTTTNYKLFYEACVGGDAAWNQTKVGKTAQFLGKLQRHCADHDLPTLTALVVNVQTGECGAGFFKDLVAIGRASPLDDPIAAATKERERCWNWASAL